MMICHDQQQSWHPLSPACWKQFRRGFFVSKAGVLETLGPGFFIAERIVLESANVISEKLYIEVVGVMQCHYHHRLTML